MKIFDLRDHYRERYGEYIVGSRETGRHSVYLVYGEVPAGETRTLAPDGHHELLLLLTGEARLEKAGTSVLLASERVVSLDPDETVVLRSVTDCHYVVAGAHAAPHEH